MKRAIICLHSDLIAQLIGVPDGVTVRSVMANWETETVDVMLEGDSLPVEESLPGTVPPQLGITLAVEDGRVRVLL